MQIPQLFLPNKTLYTDLPAYILGVVNLTSDSFYAQSRKTHVQSAAETALKMVNEGADIIDLGAESTRPGAEYVEAEQEIELLVPVIQKIREYSDCVISVDTRKKKVFEAAYNAGADILNDVSALEDDSELAFFCAQKKNPLILMHKKGIPAIMQKDTFYKNVVQEVTQYLIQRKKYAVECGIEDKNIIVDAGIGFGKNTAANYALLKNGAYIAEQVKSPLLVGLSRKSLFEHIEKKPQDRLAPTIAANVLAVLNGASFLRVHDVKETVSLLKVLADYGRYN